MVSCPTKSQHAAPAIAIMTKSNMSNHCAPSTPQPAYKKRMLYDAGRGFFSALGMQRILFVIHENHGLPFRAFCEADLLDLPQPPKRAPNHCFASISKKSRLGRDQLLLRSSGSLYLRR